MAEAGTECKPLFLAKFNDAYTFRGCIEYLKCTNTIGNFVFGPEGITYQQSSTNQDILNVINIRRSALPCYFFAGEDQQPVVVGVTMTQFRDITRTIGKKDQLELFMLDGNKHFFIRPTSHASKSTHGNGVTYILPRQVPLDIYEVEGYRRTPEVPNCTTPVQDFAKMCTSMGAMKFDHVRVVGYPNGLSFEGIMDGNITGKIDRFGDCSTGTSNENAISKELANFVANLGLPSQPEMVSPAVLLPGGSGGGPRLRIVDPAQLPELKIKMTTIKALGKLSNLCPNGTLRLTLEAGLPLRINCNIGNYGELTIYVRENTPS